MKQKLSTAEIVIASFFAAFLVGGIGFFMGYQLAKIDIEDKAVKDGAAEYYLDKNFDKKFRFKSPPTPEVWVSPTTPENSWKPQPKKGLHRDNPNTTSLRGLRLFPKAETVPHEDMPEVRRG